MIGLKKVILDLLRLSDRVGGWKTYGPVIKQFGIFMNSSCGTNYCNTGYLHPENGRCGESRPERQQIPCLCGISCRARSISIKKTSAPEFSKDSRWIVFSEPTGEDVAAGIAYQVKLVCLADGEEQIFRGIESFTFTSDSKCLILKGKNAGDAVELNLYDLEKKWIKNIANIQEYTVDPTGKYLAYTLKS